MIPARAGPTAACRPATPRGRDDPRACGADLSRAEVEQIALSRYRVETRSCIRPTSPASARHHMSLLPAGRCEGQQAAAVALRRADAGDDSVAERGGVDDG